MELPVYAVLRGKLSQGWGNQSVCMKLFYKAKIETLSFHYDPHLLHQWLCHHLNIYVLFLLLTV